MSKMTSNNFKLLGTMPDYKLADQLGVSTYTIFSHRQRLGIKAWGSPERIWTPDNIALLGTMFDKTLAYKLGIHPMGVFNLRKKLGISSFRKVKIKNYVKKLKVKKLKVKKLKPIEWTDEIISKFGKVPDRVIGYHINRSVFFARNERIARGIPPFKGRKYYVSE